MAHPAAEWAVTSAQRHRRYTSTGAHGLRRLVTSLRGLRVIVVGSEVQRAGQSRTTLSAHCDQSATTTRAGRGSSTRAGGCATDFVAFWIPT